MSNIKTRTKALGNYSPRHRDEVCLPENRVREYIPEEPRSMVDGRSIEELRSYDNDDNKCHRFAYESTKRVHIYTLIRKI